MHPEEINHFKQLYKLFQVCPQGGGKRLTDREVRWRLINGNLGGSYCLAFPNLPIVYVSSYDHKIRDMDCDLTSRNFWMD